MSDWEIASPARNSGRYVSIGLHDGRFRLSVSAAVRTELGWAETDRVAVFFGKGDQLGKARVARDARGYSGRGTGTEGKRSLHIEIRHPIGLVQEGRSQRAEFTIDGEAIIVTLPPEFLASEE